MTLWPLWAYFLVTNFGLQRHSNDLLPSSWRGGKNTCSTTLQNVGIVHWGRWHISQLSLAVWLMKVQCWHVQEPVAAAAVLVPPPAPATSTPGDPADPSAPEAITNCSTVAHWPDCFHSIAAALLRSFTAFSKGSRYSCNTIHHYSVVFIVSLLTVICSNGSY